MKNLSAIFFAALLAFTAPSAIAQVQPGSGVGAFPPITSGHCAEWLNSYTIEDAGSACTPAGSGFPITLGSTSIAANSTTTAITGLTLTASGVIEDSANGSNSVAPLMLDGTILTGGSATTNFPALFIRPTGTAAVTTWSTAGTGLGMNLASGFAGNFLDFHIAGGGSLFALNQAGTITSSGAGVFGTNIQAGNSSTISWSGRGILTSTAVGVIQLGLGDAASPVAQTLQVQSVVAGNANTAGATFTIAGSKSNGSGGGDMVFQTTLSNAASGTQNTLATALTLKGGTQAGVFAGALTMGASISAQFGTTGVAFISNAYTQTDSTSSGTVANAYGSLMGADTFATAVSSVTITNAYNTYFQAPVAGAHTTLTGAYAVGADSINVTGNNVTLSGISLSTNADLLCYAVSTGRVTYETTGTTCTVSARRFKQDIVDQSLDHDYNVIMGVKPVSFRFKKGVGQDDGAVVHHGLIAEDMEKYAPELVAYEKDGQTHGIKYGDGELQSYIIGAMQKQKQQIADLKIENARLRAANENMKAQDASFDERLLALEHPKRKIASAK